MIRFFIYLILVTPIFSQNENLIGLLGDYERRKNENESNEQARNACIDSARYNAIEKYAFNKYDDYVFQNIERNQIIYQIIPFLKNETLIMDQLASGRLNGHYIKIKVDVNKVLLDQAIQQIIEWKYNIFCILIRLLLLITIANFRQISLPGYNTLTWLLGIIMEYILGIGIIAIFFGLLLILAPNTILSIERRANKIYILENIS